MVISNVDLMQLYMSNHAKPLSMRGTFIYHHYMLKLKEPYLSQSICKHFSNLVSSRVFLELLFTFFELVVQTNAIFSLYA